MAVFRHEQDPVLPEMRARLIHIEAKVDDLMARIPPDETFHGSPQQRYGHITYSQHGEDMVFAALLERFGVERPTYVDIGANHPTICSNTALLYQRGGRGVNIGVAGQSGEMMFYRAGPPRATTRFHWKRCRRSLHRRLISRSPTGSWCPPGPWITLSSTIAAAAAPTF